jgi:hypothetical protein
MLAGGVFMPKERAKMKNKSKRKPEYSKAGTVLLEDFQRSNRGRTGEEINNIIMGGPKRGHGRGKASDAGPSKKRRAA